MNGINGAHRVAPAPPNRTLLLVNGLPGSGKTTLAKRVSRLCGVPVYSKDAIKDMLAEAEPVEPDPAWLSERAHDVLWALAGLDRRGAIVETWFGPTGSDRVLAGIHKAGFTELSVEIWCDVSPQLARDRFLVRAQEAQRHPRHLFAGGDPDWWDHLDAEGPLGIARVVRVNTSARLSDVRLKSILRVTSGSSSESSVRVQRPR